MEKQESDGKREPKSGEMRKSKGNPGGARAGRLYPPARCLRSSCRSRASKAEKRPRD